MNTNPSFFSVLFESRVPLIRQSTAAECGLACLAMIAGKFGYRIDLNSLRTLYPVSLKGMNLRQVLHLGDRMGLVGRAVRLEPEYLSKLRLPALLHWDMDHFVVLTKVDRKKVTLHDPGFGRRVLSMSKLADHFTGVAVEFAPGAHFKRADERRRIGLAALWTRLIGLRRSLAQIILLSLLLQAVSLSAPLYTQLVIDQAVVRADTDLLLIIALGFGGLAASSAVSTFLRRMIYVRVGQNLSLGLTSNVFRHLLALPSQFFELRHMGDILSRFGSTSAIQSFVSDTLVAAIIDGLITIVSLAILLAYSVPLTMMVILGISIDALLHFLTIGLMRRLNEDKLVADAEEDTNFMETMRAQRTIKLFNREVERFSVWLNKISNVMNASYKIAAAGATIDLVQGLAAAIIGTATVYLAARYVIGNQITLGMMLSFLAYQQYFSGSIDRLINAVISYRLLSLHTDRLADIVLSPVENTHTQRHVPAHFFGKLEIRDLSFRYEETDPPLLEEINMLIEPGETIAITGSSGGGKTTLMKIMLGLMEPRKGEVRVDDIPLSKLDPTVYRRIVGVIMQDDVLLSGSIAENIAFFDPEIDYEWVEECARLAAIYDDINAMPMRFSSLIGDMGSALSGGQKQRLMLARALYRRPLLLFIDEGTAHLDLETERIINDNLSRLGVTRIIIAHRPDSLRIADRAYRLENGKLHMTLTSKRRILAEIPF